MMGTTTPGDHVDGGKEILSRGQDDEVAIPRQAPHWAAIVIALLIALGSASTAVYGAPAEVPAPFAPLETRVVSEPEQGSDGAIEVRPWGRTYRFVRGPLPAQIVSQGVELLATQPRWSIGLGGRSVRPDWSVTSIDSATVREIVLESSADLGGVELRARTLVDYDGMIRVDLELVGVEPADTFELETLSYEIPLRPEVALWFNHHVSYDYQTLNIDKQKLVTSIGYFPDGSRGFDYTPTFFLGNYDVGIEWWSDENLRWTSAKGRSPIELEAREGEATLRIAPISARQEVQDSWKHRFALFPTPMRPAAPRWRSNRFISPSAARLFERQGFDYYWIAFPGQIFPHHHGLPATPQNAEQAALRERLRRDGVGYIPYGKLMAAPSYHPKTLENRETWPANRRLFTAPTASERILMEGSTDWEDGEWYSYNVCAGRVDYFDWILSENLRTLREEDLDGIYFDFGSISSICETDPRLEEGDEGHAWHYFELRDFYKELYERVQEIDPEALITIHTNGQPRALTAWVDYNFVGEALNALFRGGLNWRQIKKRPELYNSDYFQIPEPFLMAQTMPRIGGVTSILPQLHKARLEMDPAKLIGFQRGFLSQILVNDTHFWFGNSDHPALVETIAALDRFGSLDEAEFEAWWRSPASLTHSSELKVSVYRRAGALLAVAANWTGSTQEADLQLRPSLVATEDLSRWWDLEKMPLRPTKIVDGKVTVRVPPQDFRLIMIR